MLSRPGGHERKETHPRTEYSATIVDSWLPVGHSPIFSEKTIDKSLTSAVWSEVVDVRDTSPTAEAISGILAYQQFRTPGLGSRELQMTYYVSAHGGYTC